MTKAVLGGAAFLKIFAVLFAFGSAPILALALILALRYGFDWKSALVLLALLISPMCWAAAQSVASRMLLPLEGSMLLSATSIGVAYVVLWAMAWEGSGHDGMAMGYALHGLNFFSAVMALAYYVIWKYRQRLGIAWAFRRRE